MFQAGKKVFQIMKNAQQVTSDKRSATWLNEPNPSEKTT